MLKFVCFAAKLQLNIHDLNNESGAGNVTDIRLIEFLDETGRRVEAPAVSGRMLKHWHYEGMRQLALNNQDFSVSLCDGCRIGEPIRPAELRSNQLVQVARSQKEAVEKCALCDIHGYLIAQGAEGGQRGVSSRRSSRAMFSWLMPVLTSESTYRQVVHTRVSEQEEVAEGEQAAQMIYYKSYASGIYGFVSALDVERIGVVESELETTSSSENNDDERKKRIKLSIEAYRQMLTGKLGASLSHAIPHSSPLEVVVIYSEKGPLPFPVSPIYSDYIEKTLGIIPSDAVVLYWGTANPDRATKVASISEIFEKLFERI